MIDKYAEISDRVLLYNALKGILRVKQADERPRQYRVKNIRQGDTLPDLLGTHIDYTKDLFVPDNEGDNQKKFDADGRFIREYHRELNKHNGGNSIRYTNHMKDTGIMDRLRGRYNTGIELLKGSNGIYEDAGVNADPTWRSRLRQGLAIGSVGLGTAGGAGLGYYGGRSLSNALGLTDSENSLARIGGHLIAGTGAIGGGTLGFLGGTTLAGYLGGNDDQRRREGVLMQQAGDAAAEKAKDKEDYKRSKRTGRILAGRVSITPW